MSSANSRNTVFPIKTLRNMVLPYMLWSVPLTHMMDDRSLYMTNFCIAGVINYIHAKKMDMFACTVTVRKHWNNLKMLEWQSIVEYFDRGSFLTGLKCVSLCVLIFSDITFAEIKLWNYYYYYCHCYYRHYVRCDHFTEPSSSIKSLSVLTSKDTSSHSRRAVLPEVSHCLFVCLFVCLFYQYL
jgi:hypothetical protein